MNKLWIVLDCSYLIYRAQYSIRDDTSPIYGFISTMLSLRQRFDSENFVFCFDSRKLKRQTVCPEYKQRSRNEKHEEQHAKAQQNMPILRKQVLPDLGFENLLYQNGYEADDLIASVCHNTSDDVVIVSSDNDLFQLLSPNVFMYNPNKEQIINEDTFVKQWNISPEQWPLVKAIAGCSSDNIKGIRGIGEKTAAKYLSGDLGWHTVAYDKIRSASRGASIIEIEKRLELVRLPFAGVRKFELQEDRVNWRRLQTYTVKE